MPRGGQACGGEIIKTHHFNGGGSYEYRLVTWQGQRRIGFRWNHGGEIVNCPQGIHTSVTLDAALYPAIIDNILPADVRDETRAFLGPDLANGNYPGAIQQVPNQHYVHPQSVTSPQRFLGPFEVVSNNGPGDGAYMEGWWGAAGQRSFVLGFRWNGTDNDPMGFPISRGQYPTWIILSLPRDMWPQ